MQAASWTPSAAALRWTCWRARCPRSATSASTRGSSARTRCSGGCSTRPTRSSRRSTRTRPRRASWWTRRAHHPRGRPRGLAQGLPLRSRWCRTRTTKLAELSRAARRHGHRVGLRGPRHDHRRLPARQPDHPRRAPLDGRASPAPTWSTPRDLRRAADRRAGRARRAGPRRVGLPVRPDLRLRTSKVSAGLRRVSRRTGSLRPRAPPGRHGQPPLLTEAGGSWASWRWGPDRRPARRCGAPRCWPRRCGRRPASRWRRRP